GGRVSRAVRTTGRVAPPDEVGLLCQPFRQLDGARIRRSGGHGLGLAIVQAIASAHRAELTPRAWPDEGLDIQVPFPELPAQPPGAAAPAARPGTRPAPAP